MNLRHFVFRVMINAIAIAVTAVLLPGIIIPDDSLGTLLIIGFVFSLVNAFLKPILTVLSCPLVLLTLGLFLLVINGVMLIITSEITGGLLQVESFGWAFFGGIIIALVNMMLEGALGLRDEPPPQDGRKRR